MVQIDMKMPKNCETCRLRINDSPTNVPNWICAINQWPTFYCKKSQNHANEDKYLHDCPIICSIPEGHGRMVDADAVESIIRKWFEEINLNPDILLDGVKSLPTIVPAEAERRET